MPPPLFTPLQVRHSFHPVSPEQYDAVADHNPLSCPLRALGDARSGRQLLADADTDAAIKIGSPRCTAAGAGRLERVAAAFSELCAGLVSASTPSASPAVRPTVGWPAPCPADQAPFPPGAGVLASNSIPAAVSVVASAGPPEGFAPGFSHQRLASQPTAASAHHSHGPSWAAGAQLACRLTEGCGEPAQASGLRAAHTGPAVPWRAGALAAGPPPPPTRPLPSTDHAVERLDGRSSGGGRGANSTPLSALPTGPVTGTLRGKDADRNPYLMLSKEL